jgi:hypothetical protein
VGTARATGLTYGDEQFGMYGSDQSVVREDRDDVAHVIDEPLTSGRGRDLVAWTRPSATDARAVEKPPQRAKSDSSAIFWLWKTTCSAVMR